MVTRRHNAGVFIPWELFATMDKYEEWLSKQENESEFTAELVDGYEAASYVEDNMFWGYKCAIQSCTCDDEVDGALEELYASEEFKQHERWLKWLGA